MHIPRIALLAAIALCAWLLSPACVFACSCMPPGPPATELMQSSAVFAGRVINISQPAIISSSADPTTVTFAVSSVWKGPTTQTIVVETSRDSASCGYPFAQDQEYLVYARSDGALLTASLCSATKPLSEAQNDIVELGQVATATSDLTGAAPTSPGAPSSISRILLVALIGGTLLIGLLALIVVLWQRRRHMGIGKGQHKI